MKIRPKLYHILALLSEFFTIFWCNSPSIMVQLRTNFCSQQINASFWCNIGQNFLECTVQLSLKSSNELKGSQDSSIDFFMSNLIHLHALVLLHLLSIWDKCQTVYKSFSSHHLFFITMFLLTCFLVCLSGWNFVIDFKLTSR